MGSLTCTPDTSCSIREPKFFLTALRASALLALIVAFRCGAFGTTGHAVAISKLPDCGVVGLDVDPVTDVRAFEEYKGSIFELLKRERFRDLDCLADAARSDKTRFVGATWKLRVFYGALEKPPLHATEVDWKNHLRRLQHWVSARRQSITARVALAEAYTGYGWDARGEGFSDTISESGSDLFAARLKKAAQILQQASTLKTKCPEWYAAMQDVALGEGWDLERANALLQRAIAFEPAYDAYYRNYAHFLLPKWYGRDGDSERFALESADRLGGADGDILYFQIAKELGCACNNPQFSRMSWPRVQKGFGELEKRYGVSLITLNSYALMASNSSDFVAADPVFKRIGDNWDKDTWRTEGYFKQSRDTAAEGAPLQARSLAREKAADENMQSAQGAAYLKQFQPAFATFLQRCRQAASGDHTKFELVVEIAKDGSAENAWFKTPGHTAVCMLTELGRSHDRNETPFPPPPFSDYWLKVDIDPATLNVAAN
jgi:hypothetical protein